MIKRRIGGTVELYLKVFSLIGIQGILIFFVLGLCFCYGVFLWLTDLPKRPITKAGEALGEGGPVNDLNLYFEYRKWTFFWGLILDSEIEFNRIL